MRHASPGRRHWATLGLLVALATLGACATPPPVPRTVLWDIVSTCLDPEVPGYCERCRTPRTGTCALDRPCEKTTDVWSLTEAFVAIRDIKMCGCPAAFVHGLAIPRDPVTGIEDRRRPPGIWAFAWDVARQRIAETSEIALVVNPPDLRSQDQLHVHLVRLQPGARARIDASAPERVTQLDQVWDAASRRAARTGLAGYGVLVTPDPAGGFLVLPGAASPESEFTVSRCR